MTVGALALFFTQGIVLVRGNAPTYDEAMHLAAGYSYLATGDFRLEPENPPLTKMLLAAALFIGARIPFRPAPELWQASEAFAIGQRFLYCSPIDADTMLATARLTNLLLGGLLVLLVGVWARRLWGPGAGMVAVALAALDPNLVAHSSLVTTDTAVTLFVFTTLYLLWEHARSGSRWLAAMAGASAGLAMASKYSSIVLAPIVGAVLAIELLRDRITGGPGAGRGRLARAAMGLGLFAIPIVAVVSAAYLGRGLTLWASGLQHFLSLARVGQPAFFLGEHGYVGWWAYYPVAFAIKTPVGTLVVIAASILLAAHGSRLGLRESAFLVLPVLAVLGALTQASVNIGLRHALAVYPFLIVLGSRLVTVRLRWPRVVPWLTAAAVAATGASALRVAPHQLAYFNELVGGPAHGAAYLSDSNIDWGQDLKRLAAFVERQRLPVIYLSYFGTAPPAYYGIRYQYVPGTWPLEWPPPPDQVPADLDRKMLAVSVVNAQDVATPGAPLFAWLRTRRAVARVGHSINVYDLTDDVEGLVALTEGYLKAGLPDMAAAEAAKILVRAPDHAEARRLLEQARRAADGLPPPPPSRPLCGDAGSGARPGAGVSSRP